MGLLILGLVLFLGTHSIRIVAESGRAGLVESEGLNGCKVACNLIAVKA